jgi:LytS/YehU family sensor histidine kinase
MNNDDKDSPHSSTRPELNKREHDAGSPEREVNSPEREVNSPERDINSPELDLNTSKLNINSHDAISKQRPNFWYLHTLGWLGYVLIFSFDNILFTHERNASFFVIVPLMVSGTMAFLLTLPLRKIYARCWHLSPQKLIATIIYSSFIVALIWTPAKNTTMWLMSSQTTIDNMIVNVLEKSGSYWGILSSLSYSFFMILAWSSLYFGINYHYRLLAEKQLHIDAVRLSHYAQIKMLRYQINPHFLFNTLNAISTLVLQGQKEKANGMLVRLSTFLRFSLDNDPEKKIPLIEEIKASMLYLEIEKTRFEDRLSIKLRIDPQSEYLLVPSLLLQPLIENSIKYAIANMASGGEIEIEARLDEKMLHLCVADNGPLLPDNSSVDPNGNPTQKSHKGVGITNIKDRLQVLYPANHKFIINSEKERGFSVMISIPKEKA